jgi:hypothetical protein
MKRALVSLFVLALAACSDGTGSGDLLENLGIPKEAAPEIAVGAAVPLDFAPPVEMPSSIRPVRLKVQASGVPGAALVQADFTTGGPCASQHATADRTGNELVLRVTSAPNPAALCVAGGPSLLRAAYFATLGGLEAGTYRVRVVHDDAYFQHRYLAFDGTVTVP